MLSVVAMLIPIAGFKHHNVLYAVTFTWMGLNVLFNSTGLNDCTCCSTVCINYTGYKLTGYKLPVWTLNGNAFNMCQYSRNFLLQRRRLVNSVISPALKEIINSYSLQKGLRTSRGGTRKHRKIPVLLPSCRLTSPVRSNKPSGVNFTNLVYLTDTRKFDRNTVAANLSIGLWNARSITQKTTAVCDFVAEHKCDLFGITETWLTGKKSDSISAGEICTALQGYSFISVPRHARTGGGVAFVVRETLNPKRNKSSKYITFEHLDVTLLTAAPVRIVLIYRPPPSMSNKCNVSQFFEEFATLLETLITFPGSLLIVGDFNFHVDDIHAQDSKKLLELLLSMDLVQHVHQPTHMKGHTLDLVISRCSDQLVKDVVADPDMPSDHSAIIFHVSIKKPPLVKKTITTRLLKKLNLVAFRDDLYTSVCNIDMSSTSLSSTYDEIFHSILDAHAPVKSKTLTIRPSTPWYTDQLHQLKVEKRKLERNWKRTGLEVHRQIFGSACKNYYSLLNKAKVDYYSAKIGDSDQRSLFQFLNKTFGRAEDHKLPCDATADDINDFFIDKISRIRTVLDSQPQPVNTYTDTPIPLQTSLPLWKPVTETVLKTIVMTSACKSSAADPVPAWLFKECLDIILPLVATIINQSLSTGIVPSNYKHAIVTPLLKKQDADVSNLSNYRPVSNLPYLSKCLERVVAKDLQHYLIDNNLYDVMQSAYRPHHSTETSMLKIFNDVLLQLDRGAEVALVMLDLSAAFDTIDHDLLLQRLQSRYGITGTAHGWIKSYLEGRSQSVHIPSSTSRSRQLSWGVPQGSVLGPVLFSLYTGPLGDLIASHGISYISYADDTQLYISFGKSSAAECQLKMEGCLNEVRNWMLINKLKLNDSKTEVLHFSSKFRSCSLLSGITIGSEVVHPASFAKTLGVTLDPHLGLDKHLMTLSRSSIASLQYIGRLRRYLDNKSCERLVHAFIISKIDYCNSILQGLPKQKLDYVQRLQNAAARIVTRTRRNEHISHVLQTLHWLPVRQRVQYKIALITFKALHSMAPAYLSALVTQVIPSRTLRSSSQCRLHVPKSVTKTLGERAFSVCAPQIWNSLPSSITNSDNIDNFKSQLKTFLFKEAFN